MTSIAALTARSGIADHKPDQKIADAASQFEALLLGEMLKSAQESNWGDAMGDQDAQTGTSLAEMAQEQFAQALAKSGGLGFAKMVTAQLARAPSSSRKSADLLIK